MEKEIPKKELVDREIPSLLELCVKKIVPFLNADFAAAKNKHDFIKKFSEVGLPPPANQPFAQWMVESNGIKNIFPPVLVKEIPMNERAVTFASSLVNSELAIISYKGDELRLVKGQNCEKKYYQNNLGYLTSNVAFSPDGHYLAWAIGANENGNAKNIMIWDRLNWCPQKILSGDKVTVNWVSFDPTSTKLASASDDKMVRIWDLKTGDELYSLSLGCLGVFVGWRSDGLQLATFGFLQANAYLWDLKTRSQQCELSGHKYAINTACYHPSGKQFATGSHDKKIRLWNTVNGRVQYVLYGHKKTVLEVNYNHAGTQLVSCCQDKTIRFWDPQLGTALYTIIGSEDSVICYGVDDSYFVTAGAEDKKIRVWSWEQSKLTPEQFFILQLMMESKKQIYLDKELMSQYNQFPEKMKEQLINLKKLAPAEKGLIQRITDFFSEKT